jgi:hypothetical protein
MEDIFESDSLSENGRHKREGEQVKIWVDVGGAVKRFHLVVRKGSTVLP